MRSLNVNILYNVHNMVYNSKPCYEPSSCQRRAEDRSETCLPSIFFTFITKLVYEPCVLYLFNKMFIHNAVGLVCLNAQPHDFSDYVGVRQV